MRASCARRIESVLCQTCQDVELTLLDDCSTDDIRSTISKFADDPNVRIEFNEVNWGIPRSLWRKSSRSERPG
jgi:glycosyltransferase involved in cell wall biosynthesis